MSFRKIIRIFDFSSLASDSPNYEARTLKKVIDKYAHANASLSDLRIASLCALGFAGFFRLNEIVNILPKHLEFHDDFLKIFIPRSKTDVYREGNFVFICKISGIYCPVNLILKYVNMAGVYLDSDLPLFRASLITNRLTRILLDLVSYFCCL